MISHGRTERCGVHRRLRFADHLIAIEGKGALGALQAVPGSLGVCPEIIPGAGHIKLPGGNGGQQQVLVHRQGIFLAAVFGVFRAEPVGEYRVDGLDRFPVIAAAQACAGVSGVVGDHQPDPLIVGTGPDGGLAQTGMAHHGNMPGINGAVLHHIIHRPHQAKGPGADGHEFLLIKQGNYPAGIGFAAVGGKITGENGRHGIAPGNRVRHIPAAGLCTPVFRPGAVFGFKGEGGQNGIVLQHGVVAVEVQPEDHRSGGILPGNIQQHQRVGGTLAGAYGDSDLLADGRASQGFPFLHNVKGSGEPLPGQRSVNMLLEQLQNFLPAGTEVLRGGDGGTVSHDQRIREGGVIPPSAEDIPAHVPGQLQLEVTGSGNQIPPGEHGAHKAHQAKDQHQNQTQDPQRDEPPVEFALLFCLFHKKPPSVNISLSACRLCPAARQIGVCRDAGAQDLPPRGKVARRSRDG